MADSIVRLRVESQEYDQKLKQATQGLTRYVDECRKVGGTLTVVEKDTLDYVRALGQMDTTSRTATGKLAEMKKAFVELSAQYKQLTDEEKASPFGKALASGLDQLKSRIGDSKQQLDGINRSINGGGGLTGSLDALAGKIGMNVKSLTGWGTALAAGTAALNVAKDAFFASEENVDEWGRTVDASKSLYEGFLTALNTGDISGYLSRIDDIVDAARRAYDELDKLGTMRTIQSPKISAQQADNDRIRMMIQTGKYIARVNGPKEMWHGETFQQGQKLTAEQIRRFEVKLNNGVEEIVKLTKNEVQQTTKAIDALYQRQSKELGMSLQEFRKGTSSWEEFTARMEGYDRYQKWNAAHTTIDQQSGREIVARGNPHQQYAAWGTFRVDGDRYNQIVQLIQQRDQQMAQTYSMQGQAYRTINRAEGNTVRNIMRDGTSPTSPTIINPSTTQATKEEVKVVSDSVADLTNDLKYLQAEQVKATNYDEWRTYAEAINEVSKRVKELKGELPSIGGKLPDMKALGLEAVTGKQTTREDILARGNERMNREFKDFDEKIGSKGKDDRRKDSDMAKLTKAVSAIGSIKEGLKQMGVKLPAEAEALIGGINGLVSVVQGVSAIISLFSTGTQTANTIALTANTVALGTLTTAMVANTATNFIPFFAHGGVVPRFAGGGLIGRAALGMAIPGNSFSGDNLRLPVVGGGAIAVNSGEVILNRAQAGVISSALEGNGMQNIQLDAVISGEDIRLVLNNNGRRTGRGEYVQSKNKRR